MRGLRRTPAAVAAAALSLVVAVCAAGAAGGRPPAFVLAFDRPDGLVTNEFALWHRNKRAVVSPLVVMTSGSLFAVGGLGWTGPPDDVAPNARSANGTDSSTFRLVTRRRNFGNVRVSLRLRNERLVETERTPAKPYDGVHVFLRYRNQAQLYAASVNRRDDTVAIKKKVPGGDVNGGTYYDLAPPVASEVRYGAWQKIVVTATDTADGAVVILVYIDGRLVTAGIDRGVGGPPLTGTGGVGLRGDNAEFYFDDFVARPS